MAAIIERFYTPGLAQIAYLVADSAAGVAAIIDPRRDVDEYLAWTAARGRRIVAALETHIHADFVSGTCELAAATRATIYASALGEQDFPHQALNDGEEVSIGALRLRALWTPGHTPEHLAYLLFDPAAGDTPQALFSGDALFVGDVGRPDLLGERETQGLAAQLYHTVAERLSRLPGELLVYPGHGAGSACGKKIGDAAFTTIGQEKLVNYAFQARRKAQFVRMVLDGLTAPPTYYPILKRVNKAGAPLLDELPAGQALAPAEVAARLKAGTLVVDTRDQLAFGAGHIPSAVFAQLGPNFTAWLGWLAPYDREIIVLADDEAAWEEARTELRRIGLDRVAGYVQGGMAAWAAAGQPVTTLPQLAPRELQQRLTSGAEPLTVLDVRTDDEWQSGHIAGAFHQFAGEIAHGATPALPTDQQIAVICGSGYRSSVTASVLQQRGLANGHLYNVTGGMEAWQQANLPVVRAS